MANSAPTGWSKIAPARSDYRPELKPAFNEFNSLIHDVAWEKTTISSKVAGADMAAHFAPPPQAEPVNGFAPSAYGLPLSAVPE